jgi:hypothetical protein
MNRIERVREVLRLEGLAAAAKGRAADVAPRAVAS